MTMGSLFLMLEQAASGVEQLEYETAACNHSLTRGRLV